MKLGILHVETQIKGSKKKPVEVEYAVIGEHVNVWKVERYDEGLLTATHYIELVDGYLKCDWQHCKAAEFDRHCHHLDLVQKARVNV
jgi:hypothetical protein